MRRRSERRLSEEEVALWSCVAATVRALPGRRAPSLPLAPAADGNLPSGAPAAAPAAPAPPAAKPELKPILPLDRRQMTALKRGRAPLEAVIDLHGMRQDEAHARLIAFLRRGQGEGARTVLVVTGKGAAGVERGGGRGRDRFGDERGVLRRMVPHWLRLPELRDVVMGFEEAALPHGGAGALYVRLRRAPAGARK